MADDAEKIDGIPVTRHWLIPKHLRPKVYAPHPVMSPDEIRKRTQGVWDEFYRLPLVWQRAKCVKSMKSRLAFVHDLEAVPADVRQHRHLDRQRALEQGASHDPADRAGRS